MACTHLPIERCGYFKCSCWWSKSSAEGLHIQLLRVEHFHRRFSVRVYIYPTVINDPLNTQMEEIVFWPGDTSAHLRVGRGLFKRGVRIRITVAKWQLLSTCMHAAMPPMGETNCPNSSTPEVIRSMQSAWIPHGKHTFANSKHSLIITVILREFWGPNTPIRRRIYGKSCVLWYKSCAVRINWSMGGCLMLKHFWSSGQMQDVKSNLTLLSVTVTKIRHIIM